MYAPNKSFKDNLSELRVNSQATRDSTKSRLRHLSKARDLFQETNMITIKPVFFSQQGEGNYSIHGLRLYDDLT